MGALTGLVKPQLSDAAFLIAIHIGGQLLIPATIVVILRKTASCDFRQNLIGSLVEWFMTKLRRYCLFCELKRTLLLRKWMTVWLG